MRLDEEDLERQLQSDNSFVRLLAAAEVAFAVLGTPPMRQQSIRVKLARTGATPGARALVRDLCRKAEALRRRRKAWTLRWALARILGRAVWTASGEDEIYNAREWRPGVLSEAYARARGEVRP